MVKNFIYLIALNTVIAGLGGLKVFGFAFHGWSWIISLFISLFLFFGGKGRAHTLIYIWFPWIVWVLIKTDFSDLLSIQRCLLLLTPIIVFFATIKSHYIKIRHIKNAYLMVFGGSWLVCLIYSLCVVLQVSINKKYGGAGQAMTFELIAIAALGYIRINKIVGFLGFITSLIYCVIFDARIEVLAIILISSVAFPGFAKRRKIILFILGFFLAGAIFYSSPVQREIFWKGEGTICDLFSFNPKIVKSSGRLTNWPVYFQGIKNIWIGEGCGSSMDYGLKTFRSKKWSHPHNEFIRVIFEFGIIGFILLILPFSYIFSKLTVINKKKGIERKSKELEWVGFVSRYGLLSLFLISLTDNVLLYGAFFGNLLFVTIGANFILGNCPPWEKVSKPSQVY